MSGETPKVTICMPTLNAEAYLEETLESVCQQRFNDWELSILDGSSTDGTLEILKRFAKRDPRIRIQTTTQKGIYKALNTLIQSSTAPYVTVLMADDPLHPDMLRTCINIVTQIPDCGIVQVGLTKLDAQSGAIEGTPTQLERFLKDNPGACMHYAPLDGMLHAAFRTLSISLTQLFIHRHVFAQSGYFREDLGLEADFEWSARVRFSHNVLYLPEPLAYWRQHESQATAFRHSEATYKKFLSMYRLAWQSNRTRLPSGLTGKDLEFPYWTEAFQYSLTEASIFGKCIRIVKHFCGHPGFTLKALIRRLRRQYEWIPWMKNLLWSKGLDRLIQPIDTIANHTRL